MRIIRGETLVLSIIIARFWADEEFFFGKDLLLCFEKQLFFNKVFFCAKKKQFFSGKKTFFDAAMWSRLVERGKNWRKFLQLILWKTFPPTPLLARP